MSSLLGQRLAHLRVDAVLAEGGMGVVDRATDEKLHRQVALKVLPDALAANRKRRDRRPDSEEISGSRPSPWVPPS